MSSFRDARSGRRVVLGLATLAAVMATVAAGCGVPGSSDPRSLDDAPGVNGPAAPAESVELPVPTRESSAADLVRNFLKIGAAADWSPDLRKEERIDAAAKYAGQFLTREAREAWKPVSTSIDVIQVLTVVPRIDNKVVVTYRRVGVLDGNGTLTPLLDAPAEESLDFQVAPLGESGPLLLASAPVTLLPLSLEGLQTLFEVRPVYFWEPLNRFLVPDRRYLSKGISPEKRMKAIVERVLAGPSPFLSKAVADPLAKAPRGNPVLNGNNVVVDLPVSEQTYQAQGLERLATQLRWSLHPNRYSVELLIEGRNGKTFSGPEYELFNPSQSPSSNRTNGQRLYSNDQRLYGAVNGSVRPLRSTEAQPSILSLPENSNVESAAVNTKQNSAALVRVINGQKSLWVGRTPADGSAAKFQPARFNGPVSTFSRPSYLPGAGDRVLIVADGQLYDVDLGTGEAFPVSVPTVGGAVAVSVAPDGARVAIVTDAKAYVTTIDSTKRPAVINTSGTPAVQEVYVGKLSNLRGVGWFYEHQIAVGGRSGIVVAAIDGGALERIGPDLVQLGVTLNQLSAVPWNPIGGEGGNLVFEGLPPTNVPAAYIPYRSDLEKLEPPAVPGATPAPSASGSGGPPATRVTAPFYADVV